MWNQEFNRYTLLSSLWVFVMINFFARGLHELGRPGMIEQIMSGEVNGVVVTEGLMLFAGVTFEIPILMVVLSLVVRRGLNRCLTFFAVPATIVMIVMENLNPDLDNIFFMTMQIGALLVAFRVAWKWNEAA
ncbi:DUF6326 family protein [Marimonas arenosa]|uniref:DUF6326 family protein n=1 Tax=Marimonas arenosa TaxID=1795305 RepID=A0AAE3WBR1_9RHOB|nr:DUF6326 family protein [Marimonas arenosa]MDQ2088723.1 DUF6326 family protein [Marimonas arenosa]